MNHWVWVVAPEGYLDQHGGEHPRLEPGSVGTRCCHPATRRGDRGVLYRSRHAKDLAYLLRATSDAAPGPDGAHCEVEVLARLPRPVPIAELRADPLTAGWSTLRASFVRRVAAVPDDVWHRILDLAHLGSDE